MKDFKAYLIQLKCLCDKVSDPMQREVFYAACKRYQDFKNGKYKSKNITKEELIQTLIDRGLMAHRLNPKTQKKDLLPDDRPVREAARELLCNGYPLMASSKESGYFIAETPEEIVGPQKENHSRAMRLLAADRGYKKAMAVTLNQTEIRL